MAVIVNELHAKILEAITPDVTFNELHKKLRGTKRTTLDYALHSLQTKGLVIRQGEVKQYTYTRADGITYDTKNKKASIANQAPDFERVIGEFNLSQEQWTYLWNNRRLPRRQLAAKLGVSKVEVNFALIKLEAHK